MKKFNRGFTGEFRGFYPYRCLPFLHILRLIKQGIDKSRLEVSINFQEIVVILFHISFYLLSCHACMSLPLKNLVYPLSGLETSDSINR